MPFKDATRRHHTHKKLQENKYLFPDSDLSEMLDDIFEKEIIQLLEPKRLERVGKTANPKYCLYHRMVNHSLKNASHLKNA